MKRGRFVAPLGVLLLAVISIAACRSQAAPTGQSAHIGQRTKTSDCQVHDALPDSACTPGAIFSTATKEKICESGYAKDVRNVPDSEKNQVYAEYGVKSHRAGAV